MQLRANHQGIICEHWSVGIGSSVLSFLTQCLSIPSKCGMVDSYHSKFVNILCLRSTVLATDLSFPFQYLRGTILVTGCSMVCNAFLLG